MFESFSRALGILKKSFGVLMDEKRLIVFPLLSGVGLIALLLSFIVPVVVFTDNEVLMVLGVLAFYFSASFVVIFFNSALVHASSCKLDGKPVSIMGSISFALSRIVNIVLWAAISATVGLILSMLRGQASKRGGIGGIVASLVVSVIGMAWSFATFFVVPVLVFENVNPLTAIKRSVDIIKKTWSEQMIGSFGLSGVFFLFYLVGILALVGAGVFLPGAIAIMVAVPVVIYLLTMYLIQATLQGIFVTELYRYSATGQATVFKEEIESVKKL